MTSQAALGGLRLKRYLALAACVVIAGASSARAQTYYVDSAAVDNPSHNGTSELTPWKTLAKVNQMTFQPGDVIRFKRGGVWRDAALTVGSSGLLGSSITFSDYGSGAPPTLDGADVVLSNQWQLHSGSVYWAPWDFGSNAVFQNNAPLARKDSPSTLTPGSFFWHPTEKRLYVYTTSGAHPRDLIIEATRRGDRYFGLVNLIGRQHVVVENLRFVRSNHYGIYIEGGGHHTLQNNEFEWCYQNVIQAAGNYLGPDTTNIRILNNRLVNNGLARHGPVSWTESEAVGINCQGCMPPVGGLISGNEVINQGGEGIQTLAGTSNLVIEKNRVVNAVDVGIYIGSGWGNSGLGANTGQVSGIVARYNYVERGPKTTSPNYLINAEGTFDIVGTLFHHNVAKGDGSLVSTMQIGSGGSSYFGCSQVGYIRGTRIYNNTFDNDGYVAIKGFGPTNGVNTFRNNILKVTGSSARLYWFGVYPACNAPNPLANYDIDYDVLSTPNPSCMIEWGTGQCMSVANWKTNTGQGAHSKLASAAEPIFTNAGAGDYSLRSLSPALNAGATLGSPYHLALAPASVWPSAVSTLDQGGQGSAWEIGAYVYLENSLPPAAPKNLR